MSCKLRKRLSFLVAVVFVISGLLLLNQLHDYQKAELLNKTAQEQVVSDSGQNRDLYDNTIPLEPIPEEEPCAWEPLDEEVLFLMDLDLEVLRQKSENVLGWIYIPDSTINYPLMEFDDNATGLNLAWDGTKSKSGCIFIECKNRRDFSDFNTIIYGHNMLNDEMFGPLRYYSQPEYFDSHNTIYIITDDSVRRYEVFAAYEAEITCDTYRLYFADDEMKQTALNYYMDKAVIETNAEPSVDDRILTLSTCTDTLDYNTRWVVQAVLTGEFSR